MQPGNQRFLLLLLSTGSLGEGSSYTPNTPTWKPQKKGSFLSGELYGPRTVACQGKTKFVSRIFFRHFARCTASLTIFNVLTAWSSELINWCWSDQ